MTQDQEEDFAPDDLEKAYEIINQEMKEADTPNPLEAEFHRFTMTMNRSRMIDIEPVPHSYIGPYFPVGCVTAIVAAGETGKTTFIVRHSLELLQADPELEIMILTGEDSVDDYAAKIFNALNSKQQNGFGYVDPEVNAEDILGRIHIIDWRGHLHRLVGSFNVPTDFGPNLTHYIKKNYPQTRLLFIETLSRFGGDETNEAMSAVVSVCEAIAVRIHGAVVPVTHTGKAQMRDKIVDLYSGRGGSALGDNCRSVVVLTTLNKEYSPDNLDIEQETIDKGLVFEVKHVKNSYGPKAADRYYIKRSGDYYAPVLEIVRKLSDQAQKEIRQSQMDETLAEVIALINSQPDQRMRKQDLLDSFTRFNTTARGMKQSVIQWKLTGDLQEITITEQINRGKWLTPRTLIDDPK